MQAVHLGFNLGRQGQRHGLELLVNRLGLAGLHDFAVKVLVVHGDGTVDQVAQDICQVGVDALHHHLIGQHTVICERDLVQDVIAHRVHTKVPDKVVGIDDVARGLGHLAVADQKPRMAEDLFGQFLAQRHEEDRPIDGVEADDILADEMDVRRPELLKVLVMVAVRVPAAEGDIVGQRVQPDVDNVLPVKCDRHAPVEGGTGDAQVL